jgi:hypothetical protein
MAGDIYGRVWKVTISEIGKTGRSWEEQDIKFSVKKTGDSSPNSLELTIINLCDDSRSFIKKKMAITLEAGYEDNSGVIFKGTIEKLSNTKPGTEWITKINSKDGIKVLRGKILSKSFGPGTSIETVIKYVATELTTSLGVTLGTIKGLSKEKFNQGRSLSGDVKSELDNLCKLSKVEWQINDNVLDIVPIGKASNTTAIRLDLTSGLLGAVETVETGDKIKSYLIHSLNPTNIVDIQSNTRKGFHIVKNLTHTGDTTGDDWCTEQEVRAA